MIIEAEFLNLLSIVAAASDKMLDLRRGRQHSSRDWRTFHETADAQAIIVVVFAVTFLEAYMQNYANRRLGSAFSVKHIDRLDVLSKWVIVPRLATLKNVPTDHVGIELLRDLIHTRNRIVHSKSGALLGYEEIQAFAKRSRYNQSSIVLAALNVPYCFRKLGEMLVALDEKEAIPKLMAQVFGKAKRCPRKAI